MERKVTKTTSFCTLRSISADFSADTYAVIINDSVKCIKKKSTKRKRKKTTSSSMHL